MSGWPDCHEPTLSRRGKTARHEEAGGLSGAPLTALHGSDRGFCPNWRPYSDHGVGGIMSGDAVAKIRRASLVQLYRLVYRGPT
ncbi:hypothetical protein [Akkermansia sp.]|uniref:hypothetical protein n=1 Tax=Akkermansia sp. TaxID=1872421 RepID=UPI003995C844